MTVSTIMLHPDLGDPERNHIFSEQMKNKISYNTPTYVGPAYTDPPAEIVGLSCQNFCYWLQGYFELTNEVGLTRDQVDIIKNHLNMVFNKPIIWNAPDPKITDDILMAMGVQNSC